MQILAVYGSRCNLTRQVEGSSPSGPTIFFLSGTFLSRCSVNRLTLLCHNAKAICHGEGRIIENHEGLVVYHFGLLRQPSSSVSNISKAFFPLLRVFQLETTERIIRSRNDLPDSVWWIP